MLQKQPSQVETEMATALSQLSLVVKERHLSDKAAINLLLFPTVRECNAALAALGDSGELLRALRLFGKMRKAGIFQARLQSKTNLNWPVPVPTLVTYSTLMSRAVKASKPLVALRLWNIMGPEIVPDLKAANILMNCYAKLADVENAEALLDQMKNGGGYLVPRISPNLVTYNTVLNACQRAGKLDEALATKEDLERYGLIPDARTYTSLIATVARKPSLSSGQNDPSLAFSLLKEMQDRGIRPNGMTFSALIDTCGRCQRTDLALQGLRIMLRQKSKEREATKETAQQFTLANEVGAWTAAIDACCKAGRLDTARRLFTEAMPSFGCMPNIVTCGCLLDSYLRQGRTSDALDVLRYMKKNRISPSPVLYTSLMTHTERLVQVENKAMFQYRMEDDEKVLLDESGDTRAIAVYTELMQLLMDGRRARLGRGRNFNPESSELVRVFLIFQEMKAAGATPDVACYNTLLRACARSSDLDRARDVIQQMTAEGVSPNDISWRELLRCAAVQGQGDVAEEIWEQGLAEGSKKRVNNESKRRWKPSIESFTALLSAYVAEAGTSNNLSVKLKRYRRVMELYNDVLLREGSMGADRIDVEALLSDNRAMLIVLTVAVSLEELSSDSDERSDCRSTARAIQALSSLQSLRRDRMSPSSRLALRKAQDWAGK